LNETGNLTYVVPTYFLGRSSYESECLRSMPWVTPLTLDPVLLHVRYSNPTWCHLWTTCWTCQMFCQLLGVGRLS